MIAFHGSIYFEIIIIMNLEQSGKHDRDFQCKPIYNVFTLKKYILNFFVIAQCPLDP